RLPWAERLAEAAARARRPARRRRRRDPRPARAGAAERRRPLAGRPGDGPPDPCRHAQRQAPRALRNRRRRGTQRSAPPPRLPRRPPHGALDLRRLAAAARPVPEEGTALSFQSPLWLIALIALPIVVALYVVLERRRQRFGGRFANPALLPNMI